VKEIDINSQNISVILTTARGNDSSSTNMLLTLQFALGFALLGSPAISCHITETFISDFLRFQRQAAPPAAVSAFLCWRQGTDRLLLLAHCFTPQVGQSFNPTSWCSITPHDMIKLMLLIPMQRIPARPVLTVSSQFSYCGSLLEFCMFVA
jgi:hypothetical protein